MTTTTIQGVRSDYDTDFGTVELTITISEGGTLSYSTVAGGVTNDLGVPEVDFTSSAAASAFAAGINAWDFDEAYMMHLTFDGGGSATVLILYDDSTGTDYIFFLDSTVPLPTTLAELNALSDSVTSGQLPTGAFAPGAAIDPSAFPLATATEDDVWTGTGADELFDGGMGNDLLDGAAGNDTLNGGAGNDTIIGGDGNDTINPGDNNGDGDYVQAGLGNDTIDFADIAGGWVSLNHDDLSGPITVDIDGVANTGSIDAGAEGTDTLINVANPLDAGWTTGGLQVDGTGGDDTFNIHTGSQQWADLRGRGGNDTFNITGNGTIRLSYNDSNGAVTADLGAGTISQDGFTDTVNGDVWEIRAGDGNDSLLGSGNDESFTGQGGNDTIDGGGGFDRVRYDRNGYGGVAVDLGAGTATGTWNGSAFTDTLSNIEHVRGGAFADTLTGDGGRNRLDGRDGNDTLAGAGGRDTLDGGDGADELLGQAGADTLDGGAGSDTLLGGGGHDRLLGQAGGDLLKGGGGSDTLLGGGGTDKLVGQAGDDLLKGGGGSDTLIGGGGDDKLVGNAGGDLLKGGGGSDTLLGGGGNDQLLGEVGDDLLKGGGAHDTLVGGGGHDRLLGQAGDDLLRGGGGRDTLLGGDGADTLKGNGGRDVLIGGAGDDLLTGGNGPDVFRFDTGAPTGDDTVTDFDNGTDLIRLDGASFDDLTITQVGGDTVITWDNGSVTLTGETGLINEDDFVFG